jgi:DHA1 family bicyclomycin/chloramphenicol resistance-like MFS transporter
MASSNTLSRDAIVLGLLTAVGPSAIDMYLPVLPAIGRGLAADPNAVQLSLMAFFVALGAGQLVAGPLSDALGRRRPLLGGLALFFVASLGCALAPTIAALIACRFVQGLGACAAMVTPRAVVRDRYSGPQAARLMSLLLMVYSVSPILAPLLGSVVADAAGWRGVFGAIAALGLLAIALVLTRLPETRSPEARRASSVAGALAGYRSLLSDRHFLALALIASLTLAGFFIYVANSSFVLSARYGVSPRAYAVLFALNAVSLMAVSQANGRLAARFGLRRTLRAAIICHAVTMTLLLVLTASGVDRLEVLVTLLLVGYGLNGVIVPTTFVLAMEGHGALAGTASALIGTLNFAGGAVVVAIVAPFADSRPLPMVAGIAACSLVVLLAGLITLRQRT